MSLSIGRASLPLAVTENLPLVSDAKFVHPALPTARPFHRQSKTLVPCQWHSLIRQALTITPHRAERDVMQCTRNCPMLLVRKWGGIKRPGFRL